MFATRNELEIVADIFATKIFVALPTPIHDGFETETIGQGIGKYVFLFYSGSEEVRVFHSLVGHHFDTLVPVHTEYNLFHLAHSPGIDCLINLQSCYHLLIFTILRICVKRHVVFISFAYLFMCNGCFH